MPMDKKNEFNLNDNQKTRLLELGFTAPEADGEDDPNELRRDRLYEIISHPIPASDTRTQTLPPTLHGLSDELVSVAGHPIGKLLQNPETNLPTLKRIKDYAKDKGGLAESDIDQDVFMSLYFAAIASALAFHSQIISQHTQENLQAFLKTFQSKPWMLKELAELYEKAITELANKTEPA